MKNNSTDFTHKGQYDYHEESYSTSLFLSLSVCIVIPLTW